MFSVSNISLPSFRNAKLLSSTSLPLLNATVLLCCHRLQWRRKKKCFLSYKWYILKRKKKQNRSVKNNDKERKIEIFFLVSLFFIFFFYSTYVILFFWFFEHAFRFVIIKFCRFVVIIVSVCYFAD